MCNHILCSADCVLYAVGKPVYHKFVDQDFGSWLRDPQPKNDDAGERYWSTSEVDNLHLFEYASKASFRTNATRVYNLPQPGFMVLYIHYGCPR